jgi:hypothetical protein
MRDVTAGSHAETPVAVGLGDRIEPSSDVGRGQRSAVSDQDEGRVVIEDALHRGMVAGTVLGEEVSQWVAGADAAAGEAASDEIADGEQRPDLRLHENGGEGLDRLVGAESFELLMHDVAATAAVGASRSEDSFVTATALWVALHGLVLLRADAPQFPWPDTTQLDDALLGRIALLEPNPA